MAIGWPTCPPRSARVVWNPVPKNGYEKGTTKEIAYVYRGTTVTYEIHHDSCRDSRHRCSAYPLGPRFAGPRQGLARVAPPPSIPWTPALRQAMARTRPAGRAHRRQPQPGRGSGLAVGLGRAPTPTSWERLGDLAKVATEGLSDSLIRRARTGVQWPSCKDILRGATPPGRVAWCAHANPPRCRSRHRIGGGRSPPRRCRPVRRRRLGWAVRNCKRPQGIASHDRVNRDRGHVCIDP